MSMNYDDDWGPADESMRAIGPPRDGMLTRMSRALATVLLLLVMIMLVGLAVYASGTRSFFAANLADTAEQERLQRVREVIEHKGQLRELSDEMNQDAFLVLPETEPQEPILLRTLDLLRERHVQVADANSDANAAAARRVNPPEPECLDPTSPCR